MAFENLINQTDTLSVEVDKINRGLLFTAQIWEDSSVNSGEILLSYPELNTVSTLQGATITVRVNKDITAQMEVFLTFSDLDARLKVLLPGSGMYFNELPAGMLFRGIIITGSCDFNSNSFYIISIGSHRVGGWGVDVDGGNWDASELQDGWWVENGYFLPEDTPLTFHNVNLEAHNNITADGNIDIVAGQVSPDLPNFLAALAEHETDTNAHQNITVDGQTGTTP